MTADQIAQAVIAVGMALAIYAAGYYRGGNDARREPMSGACDDDTETKPQILDTWHDDGGFSQ